MTPEEYYYQNKLKKYTQNTLFEKEIIRLLENTIRTESEKKGGGNKELIAKLEIRLEDVREFKSKKSL